MQITIKNYKRLKKYPLSHNDKICWNIDNVLYCGRVDNGYIDIIGHSNGRIFEILGVEKYHFCTQHYGYYTHDGDWPWANEDDYEGLSKVVIALFDLINAHNKKQL